MLKYWIWLSTRQNVSGAQAIVLLSRFGSAVAIYQADEEALKRGYGRSSRTPARAGRRKCRAWG